jgi:hypothetical protein
VEKPTEEKTTRIREIAVAKPDGVFVDGVLVEQPKPEPVEDVTDGE